jgi:hypothetical protein
LSALKKKIKTGDLGVYVYTRRDTKHRFLAAQKKEKCVFSPSLSVFKAFRSKESSSNWHCCCFFFSAEKKAAVVVHSAVAASVPFHTPNAVNAAFLMSVALPDSKGSVSTRRDASIVVRSLSSLHVNRIVI